MLYFSFFTLFTTFICADIIESLINSLFGVKNFILVFPSCLVLFRGINFTLSAVVSSGCDFKYLHSS